MKTPSEEQSKLLHAHLSTELATAPHALSLVAATLVRDPSTIRGSIASVEFGQPTVWSFYLVTDRLLAHAVIAFDAERYDLSEEVDLLSMGQPVLPSDVRESWVRPLDSVVNVAAASPGRVNRDVGWFVPGRLSLFFANGDSVELPSQFVRSQPDRERSDSFHDAVRDAIGF